MNARIDRQPARTANAKRRPERSRKSGFGGTLLGLFIGIALGLALAAGVAIYLTKAGNPYQSASPGKETSREAAREPARQSRSEPGPAEKPRFDFYKILPGVEEPKIQPKAAGVASPDKATAERSAAPDKATAERAASPDRAAVERAAPPDKALAKADDRPAPPASERQAKAAERFWLQAGSFTSEADAENLKARLAFAGWEATIQSANLPDKGHRFRVRLGPYDNTDELTRMKAELAARGFDAAVIKF
jgi:cell division protein FtsN